MRPSIAVLGCGYWGKNLARNFAELGALRLVCDPLEAARNLAREWVPMAGTSGRFEEAFEREDIKGVAIATPAETHYQLTLQALRSGKDVFVEKPMALTACEGEELRRESESAERILMVGHLLEYHPAVGQLRSFLENEELGNVNYLYSNRLNFGKIRTEENALWSFAPHDVAVILRLLNEIPIEVGCVGGNYVSPERADVTVSTFRFESGRRAHIFVSWLNPFKEQKLVVVGEQKMAVFNDVSKNNKLVLYDQRAEIADGLPMLMKGKARAIPISDEEPLRVECEHFLKCIETRDQPLTHAQSGIRVLQVLEACQQSMGKAGMPVQLDKKRRERIPALADWLVSLPKSTPLAFSVLRTISFVPQSAISISSIQDSSIYLDYDCVRHTVPSRMPDLREASVESSRRSTCSPKNEVSWSIAKQASMGTP